MNQTQAPQSRARSQPIKGSWESLHEEARSHAANFNDAAFPLYQRLIDGVLALPPKALRSGDYRLYFLLLRSGWEMIGLYNSKGRYDDSLSVLNRLEESLTQLSGDERAGLDKERLEDDQQMLISMRSDVLAVAGRLDESIALLRENIQRTAAVQEEPADLEDWGEIVMTYVKAGQPQAAFPVLQEMEEKVSTESGDKTEEAVLADRGYLSGLRAVVNLEAGRVDEGLALFDQIIGQGGLYAENLHLLYARLIHNARYDDALRFIDRDSAHAVRAPFWRGVVLKHQDEENRARRQFEEATKQENLDKDSESIVEHVLAHYYLGDREGTGLNHVLGVLRERHATSWILLYLAGLGWALRQNWRTARNNIQLANTQFKWEAGGIKLPKHFWFFFRDLVPGEHLEQFHPYFETFNFPAAPAEAPTPQSQAALIPESEETPTSESAPATADADQSPPAEESQA